MRQEYALSLRGLSMSSASPVHALLVSKYRATLRRSSEGPLKSLARVRQCAFDVLKPVLVFLEIRTVLHEGAVGLRWLRAAEAASVGDEGGSV